MGKGKIQACTILGVLATFALPRQGLTSRDERFCRKACAVGPLFHLLCKKSACLTEPFCPCYDLCLGGGRITAGCAEIMPYFQFRSTNDARWYLLPECDTANLFVFTTALHILNTGIRSAQLTILCMCYKANRKISCPALLTALTCERANSSVCSTTLSGGFAAQGRAFLKFATRVYEFITFSKRRDLN